MFDMTSGQKIPESAGKWSSDPIEYIAYRNGLNEALPQEPDVDLFSACVANAALEAELAAQTETFSSLYADHADIHPDLADLADKLWRDRLLPGQGCLAELYA